MDKLSKSAIYKCRFTTYRFCNLGLWNSNCKRQRINNIKEYNSTSSNLVINLLTYRYGIGLYWIRNLIEYVVRILYY